MKLPKRILFVLSLVLLLAVYLVFVESRLTTTDQNILIENALVYFDEGSLEQVSFQSISLIRKGESFRISAPVSHPASEKNVSNLFRELERITFHHQIQQADLALYGLDKPEVKVSLKGKGKEIVLILGDEVAQPATGECYAMILGRPEIYLIKKTIRDLCLQDFNFYMDSIPFDFLEKEPAELRIFWKEPVLLRKIFGKYIIGSSKGYAWQANQKKAEAVFSFLSDFDLSKYPYEPFPGNEEVEILGELKGFGQQKSKSLYIGKTKSTGEGFVQLEKEGLIFKVPLDVVSLLNFTFDEFVSKTAYEAPLSHLKKVVFDFKKQGRQFVFTGNQMNWKMDHPYSWLFSSGKILNYILQFMILEVHDFDKLKLESPVLTVSMVSVDPEIPDEKAYVFEDPEGKGFFLQYEGNSTVARLKEKDIFQKLTDDPFSFIDSRPFKILLEKSSEIRFLGNGDPVSLKKGSFAEWKMAEENGKDLSKWLEGMNEARCFSSMKKREGVDFGFVDPLWEIEFLDEQKIAFFSFKVGSYSGQKEAFLLGDDEFFLFFKKFFLLQPEFLK